MKILKHTVARVRNSKGEFEGIPALTGENIYEIARRYGYVGSEEDYIAEIISDGWVTGIAELQTDVEAVETDVSTLETKVTTLETDKITATTYTGTLLASGWTTASGFGTNGGYQALTFSGSGISGSSDKVIVDLYLESNDNFAELNAAWSCIFRAIPYGTEKIQFNTTEIPTIDIPVKVLVVK